MSKIQYVVESSDELEEYLSTCPSVLNPTKLTGSTRIWNYYIKNGSWRCEDKNHPEIADAQVLPLKEYLQKIKDEIVEYGYVLKDSVHLEVVNILLDAKNFPKISKFEILTDYEHRDRIKYLRDLAVLDDLFAKTPVPTPKLPIINGVEGKVLKDYLIYGCQRVHISLFNTNKCQLNSMVINDVEISESTIKKIRRHLSL